MVYLPYQRFSRISSIKSISLDLPSTQNAIVANKYIYWPGFLVTYKCNVHHSGGVSLASHVLDEGGDTQGYQAENFEENLWDLMASLAMFVDQWPLLKPKKIKNKPQVLGLFGYFIHT